MRNLITENTGVSLTLLGGVVAAAVYIAMLSAKVEASAKEIAAMSGMRDDVTVIRLKVEWIERQFAERKGRQ